MGEWYKLTYGDGETDVIRIKEGHDRHEREGDTWEPAVVFTVEELDAREKNWSDSVAVLTKMCLEYIECIAELERELASVRLHLHDERKCTAELEGQLVEAIKDSAELGLQIAELEAAADPETLSIAYGKGFSIALDRIRELEKQLAERTPQQGGYVPVEDGEYEGQHTNSSIVVDRDYLKIVEPLLGRDYGDEAEVALPEGWRLCRWQESDTP